MSIILQGVYRKQANPTISVPAPRDGAGIPHWYDHLSSHMHEFGAAGFRHWQTPPVLMTSALDYPGADGYGVFNDYDLGNDAQPTRFGTAERLTRCCAIGYANGVAPLVDWVPHQRSGGRNGVYTYTSATGKPGRFPKTPSCFRRRFIGDGDRVPQDPVPAPWDDFMFGDELCPINATPKDYVLNGLIDAGDWLWRRLDAAGCRNDDTKGQAFEAVRRWSNAKAMAGKPVIGEYAEGNRDTLAWWVRQLNFRCATYDFEVKYRARDMCNEGSRFDMRRLVNAGLASYGWPYSGCAVTFIENADSDTNGFGPVIFNKLLGYAWILTAEGWPSVYYRDYADDKDCYGLKPHINNLNWIHTYLANGPTTWRHAEYQFVVYERTGAPGLLVGLNNDIWGGWKHVTVQTNFGAGVRLHDYSGHADDVWTDWAGRATLAIPPNDNGKGYVCYGRDGLSRPFEGLSHPTAQEFEGADDLDIPPATLGQSTNVQRIWVARGAEVRLHVRVPQIEGLVMNVQAVDADGHKARSFGGKDLTYIAGAEGWHQLQVLATGTPQTRGPIPYTLRATYHAPQTMKGA